MSGNDFDQTIQNTQWTDSLLEDLCAALKNDRDDATVRAFAKELMDDKQLPLSYLVRKVGEAAGKERAERLDILVRGRHAVEKSRAEARKSAGGGGLLGIVRKFLR